MTASTAKKQHGTVGIEEFQGRYRIRLPRSLFGGKQKYICTIYTISPENRKLAEAIIQRIQADISFERFDFSLDSYKHSSQSRPKLEIVKTEKEIALFDLWQKFVQHKQEKGLKVKTLEEYGNFTKLLLKLGKNLSYDGLTVKNHLMEITTVDQTRRAISYLSACCNWGLKHKLIKENSFEPVVSDLPTRKELTEDNCYAFSQEEQEKILSAFSANCFYRIYTNLVKFWLYTGCRPSEALAVRWCDLTPDCSQIYFRGSAQYSNGKVVFSEGSKNNNKRTIPTSKKLQAVLLEMKENRKNSDDESLIFPSPRNGGFINYHNFLDIWKAVVTPMFPETTPYNCRDSFITEQILKGVSTAIIAKWCDTSVSMIEQRYADSLKLLSIRPMD